MLKKIQQTYKISANAKRNEKLDIKIYSHDINSVQFEFDLTDKDDISIELSQDYKVKVLSVFKNSKTTAIEDLVIEGNKILWVFNSNLISREDEVHSYLYLMDGEKRTDITSFRFSVELSEIDKNPTLYQEGRQFYISNLENLEEEYRTRLEQLLVGLEEAQGEFIEGEVTRLILAYLEEVNIEVVPGPKGDKGDKGDTGEPGPKGDTGLTGPQGIQGDMGPQGEPGDQGVQGEPGPQGIQGLKGEVGLQGDRGLQGDPGPEGPQGLQGEQGLKGDTGAVGPAPTWVTLTQAEYDALTPDPNTVYLVVAA